MLLIFNGKVFVIVTQKTQIAFHLGTEPALEELAQYQMEDPLLHKVLQTLISKYSSVYGPIHITCKKPSRQIARAVLKNSFIAHIKNL